MADGRSRDAEGKVAGSVLLNVVSLEFFSFPFIKKILYSVTHCLI